jgi:hypothetical protein
MNRFRKNASPTYRSGFPVRSLAVAALLVAAFCPLRLRSQVEDLGSQAQGIVDQMHAQASFWTPAVQQQSAMGSVPTSSTTGGTTITFTPNPYASAATQRQMMQQEQRIQMFQQRQQLMMAGAQAAGQLAGQLLVQAIFGSPNDEQARLAEQARQQQEQLAAEQLHQAQVNRAAQMRIDWDQRDAGMSNELADVFSAPAAKSTPAFGINSDTDPSAMGDPTVPNDGTNFFGSGGQGGSVPDTDSSPVLADDTTPIPSLAPEYLSAQQGGGGLAWAHLPDANPPPPVSQWQGALKEKLTDYGINFAIGQVKDSAAYARVADVLKYVPGYDLAMKAKAAYDYGANLKGQFEALEHPLEAVNARTITVFENGASGAAETISNIHTDGSAFTEDYWQQVQNRGADYNETDASLIKNRVKTGLSAANKQDEALLKGSDEPARVVPVSVEADTNMRVNIFQETGGHVF